MSEVLGHTNELDRAAATKRGSFYEVRAVVSGLENFSQEDLSEVRLSAATSLQCWPLLSGIAPDSRGGARSNKRLLLTPKNV